MGDQNRIKARARHFTKGSYTKVSSGEVNKT